MLIREHYARNEIKWQHEVICLSLNWVFLAGGFFPPKIFLVLHLDKLNLRSGRRMEFFVLQCVMFLFKNIHFKKWQLKCFILTFLSVSGQRLHSRTFPPAGCTRRQWMHWVKIACDSDEFCSYSSALGFVLSCWLLPCLALMLGREAHSSSSSGSGKNNKGERLPPYGISDQEKRGSVARLLFDVRFNQ